MSWIVQNATLTKCTWLVALACVLTSSAEETWWSFRELARPPRPSLATGHPIDAFVQQRLAEQKLAMSPEATRRVLIRRLYFDLLGLPPTLEAVEEFENDQIPGAYERLVDRLLAQPQYGERWARHWLDLVHYGDTHGYDKDQPRPQAWPYRDYVIRSLNADKPYATFVQEQIAGDVLFPWTADGIEALGFISAGPWDLIGHAELPESKIDGQIARHLDRDDMVANTMSTFTSLTVHCAQCHNHKFDPITSEDYYSLQAVFAALDRSTIEYHQDPSLTRERAELREAQRKLEKEKSRVEGRINELGGDELAVLRKESLNKETTEDLRQAVLKRIDHLLNLRVPHEVLENWRSTTNELSEVNAKLAKLPPPLTTFAGTVHHGSGAFRGTGPDGGKPRAIHLLARGDVRTPGKPVPAGTLSALRHAPARFNLAPDAPEGERRKALALWLTARDNPLTWRSIVNRIWQHHFGRGLVETPNDFGKMGSLPSHPDLLDWLAVEFRDGGQSFKALHRLIVTSATYRQISDVTASSANFASIDGDNKYLWRMNRRKLEAEAVRDAVLAVSGQLRPTMFGPAFRDFVVEKPEHSPHYQYHLYNPDDPASHRRSIYRFVVRSQPQPFMTVLDCADPSMQVARRNESLSALQALALLNNGFMVTMAQRFADSISTTHPNASTQVHAAFSRALGRIPKPSELAELVAHTEKHGLANTCRLLLNLNEFAFVD